MKKGKNSNDLGYFYPIPSWKHTIPKTKILSSKGLICHLNTVFGIRGTPMARLVFPEDFLNLRLISYSQEPMGELRLGALLAALLSLKLVLLEIDCQHLAINPDLVLIDPNGNLQVAILDKINGEDLLSDIKYILVLLLHESSLLSVQNSQHSYSFSLIDFVLNLQASTPVDKDSLKGVLKRLKIHRYLKAKPRKKLLKDVRVVFKKAIRSNQEYHDKQYQGKMLIPDEIKWRRDKQPVGFQGQTKFTGTSDSSGASTSKGSQYQELTPGFGSSLDKENGTNAAFLSELFLESCQEVILSKLEQTKEQTRSQFKVAALENLLTNLKDIESNNPGTGHHLVQSLMLGMGNNDYV